MVRFKTDTCVADEDRSVHQATARTAENVEQVSALVPEEGGLLSRILQVYWVDCVWNVTAHTQKPDFVFRRNGRIHLNRRGCQFSRLLADEVCASAEVMLDTPCSEVLWRALATHSIRQIPLHFSSRTSRCAITFQLDSTSCGSTDSIMHAQEKCKVGYWGSLQMNTNEPLWKSARSSGSGTLIEEVFLQRYVTSNGTWLRH